MIHTYEQTLQILYRHLHNSLGRTHLTEFNGRKVALNGNSLLRQFLLVPNVDPTTPHQGSKVHHHLQGFHEVGTCLLKNNITPLVVFEDTNKFTGYGSEQFRRRFLSDHGRHGLKFEQDKIIRLEKVRQVFHDFHNYLRDRKVVTQEIFAKARKELLDAEVLLREEDNNPTLLSKHTDKLTNLPFEFFEKSVTHQLSIHETAGEYVRNHLQRAGVQYERKVLEILQRLNIPNIQGSLTLDQDVIDYVNHHLDCAITCSKAAIPSLQTQAEDWEAKEQQVMELLDLMGIPFAVTTTNSADAVCSKLLLNHCDLAITDNPFILGYRDSIRGKVMFNFLQPWAHPITIDLTKFKADLGLTLSQIREFLILCDGDLNQGFRGLEPDFLLQMVKKVKTVEAIRKHLPNQVAANHDPDRSRKFFDLPVTLPSDLLQSRSPSPSSATLDNFLTRYQLPRQCEYYYFQAPRTLPNQFPTPLAPINVDPKILSKISPAGSPMQGFRKNKISRDRH